MIRSAGGDAYKGASSHGSELIKSQDYPLEELEMNFILYFAAALFMAGCWNGGNTAVSWGDVSVGQQLIDLQLALEAEALTESEYEDAKKALLSIATLCENTSDE